MAGVIVVGLALPVMWFGIWIPVMVAVARLNGLRMGVAVPLALLGPIGALVGMLAGRARRSATDTYTDN